MKKIEKEYGFTLVEIMAALAIFLVVVAIVLGIYVQATKYMAYFAAKDDILNSMNNFSYQISKYIDGAAAIFAKVGDTYVPWETMDDVDFSNPDVGVAFFTKRLKSDGKPESDYVYIYNEKIKDKNGRQLWFLDATDNNKCKPLTRIVVVIKETSTDTKVPNADDMVTVDWSNGRKIVFRPSIVDARDAFSYMKFYYYRYEINQGQQTMVWKELRMKSIFGVLRYIYDDSSCTHRVRGYAVNVYPYTQVFNVYGRNMERSK